MSTIVQNVETSVEIPLCVQIMNKLYLNGDKADVILEVHENGKHEPIYAHRIILATGSKVFDTMLYGGPKRENVIPITNSTVIGVKLFLQFFYMDSVKLSNNFFCPESLEVLELAQKYEVQQCFDAYSKSVRSRLNIDNVCDALTVANVYSQQLQHLHEFCREYIANHFMVIFKAPAFRRCSDAILMNILDIALMKNCNPVEIFSASMNWASYACEERQKDSSKDSKKLRSQLGDAFKLIPFNKMSLKEFALCLTQRRDLFESKEIEDIIISMAEISKKRPKDRADATLTDRADETPTKKVNRNKTKK